MENKKRNRINWKLHIEEAQKWINECEKIGITPTTTQIQKHFGWTQTIASKVKSFIKVMESSEK